MLGSSIHLLKVTHKFLQDMLLEAILKPFVEPQRITINPMGASTANSPSQTSDI